MKYTDNYGLKKPELNDYVEIDDLNENADIIDDKLKEHENELDSKETPAGAQAKADQAEQNAKEYTDQQVADIEVPVTSVNDKTGDVIVTKEDVGLGNVDNVQQASKTEHDQLAADFTAHQADEAIHVTPQEKNYWNNKLDEIKVDGRTVFINDDGELTTINPNLDDQTNAPGPKMLIAGTMDAGFFGEVPASELMNGADLCSAIGLTQGNLQHSDEPFLKFAYNGKILFVNKKPIRNSVSWDAIASAGAVYGDGGSQGNAQVTVGGLTYKVRLMKGANVDPAPNEGSSYHHSEWNKLMLPIHENAPDNWAYPNNVDSPTENWGINYTDEDLLTHNNFGDGSYSWTQETIDGDTSYRVNRGGVGVSYATENPSSNTSSYRGARFVLELL